MAFVLDGVSIRSPHEIEEKNSTQIAQHRTLSGSYRRDIFGSNKRLWVLSYRNTNKTAYDVIKAIYDDYLDTNTTKTWAITETNYPVSETSVHVDLLERGFSIQGNDYLSDFDLILQEA